MAAEIMDKKYPRVHEALQSIKKRYKNPSHHHCACGFWATTPGAVWDHIRKWERLGETKHRLLSYEEQPCA